MLALVYCLITDLNTIKNLKMKELALIPNNEGFEFIAVLRDGSEVKTKVFKDNSGLHRFVEFNDTIGWFPLN